MSGISLHGQSHPSPSNYPLDQPHSVTGALWIWRSTARVIIITIATVSRGYTVTIIPKSSNIHIMHANALWLTFSKNVVMSCFAFSLNPILGEWYLSYHVLNDPYSRLLTYLRVLCIRREYSMKGGYVIAIWGLASLTENINYILHMGRSNNIKILLWNMAINSRSSAKSKPRFLIVLWCMRSTQSYLFLNW